MPPPPPPPQNEPLKSPLRLGLNLVNECDRRFEDANLKVETYMLSRLKSCTTSLQLLENAMKNNNCVFHDKITKTLSLMFKLMNIWSKHSEYLNY